MNGTILMPALLFMPADPTPIVWERFRRKERLGRFVWIEHDKERVLSTAREYSFRQRASKAAASAVAREMPAAAGGVAAGSSAGGGPVAGASNGRNGDQPLPPSAPPDAAAETKDFERRLSSAVREAHGEQPEGADPGRYPFCFETALKALYFNWCAALTGVRATCCRRLRPVTCLKHVAGILFFACSGS